MKGPRIPQTVKEFKFEEVCGRLESKAGFQRQSVAKCLKITLVSKGNSALL